MKFETLRTSEKRPMINIQAKEKAFNRLKINHIEDTQ